jgi:hypothetical protein
MNGDTPMAIYLTMDLPVSRADIEAVSKAMGVLEDVPDGLIMHVCTETDGGVRVTDIWDSQEHFEAFRETRLNPTVGRVMAERGVELGGPPPDPEYSDAFDLVHGKA